MPADAVPEQAAKPVTLPTSKTAAFSLCKARTLLPVLQITTGVLTGFASFFGWSHWWLFGVPWMILNLPGILLAIPVGTFALIWAGVAEFEWRTQEFFIGWFITAPTLLSVLFGLVWNRWKQKRAVRQLSQPLRSGPAAPVSRQ